MTTTAPKLYDFEVRNRFTSKVQFTAKIEADPSVPFGIRLGLAVKWGLANKADLAGADLAGADLAGANLARANLARALIKGEVVARLFASVQRLEDPYTFHAFELEVGGVKIMAGCRWFTLSEFTDHVAAEYPDTSKAAETLAILDFIATRAKSLGITTEVAQ